MASIEVQSICMIVTNWVTAADRHHAHRLLDLLGITQRLCRAPADPTPWQTLIRCTLMAPPLVCGGWPVHVTTGEQHGEAVPSCPADDRGSLVVLRRADTLRGVSSREDLAFEAVVRRIAAGPYFDGLAAGPPAPLRPAPPAAVSEAEELIGQPLPSLLRRLYLEVGNGGFGPGYGLLSLRDLHRSGSTDAREGRKGRFLILCYWGCGISSELDLADGQVWGRDPNPDPGGMPCAFPQHMTVVDWFLKWAEGTLHQPWLVQDPTTGVWRGATDAEYAAVLEDMFGPGSPAD
ncbi:hypothetical protein Daura_22555 [Dactylosporangium aurantiacum]|uniref:Knr4/Smi1-like domain-containing protein n=1 Tax=Dactylosporangium aurantiacum TaxID=35754 RepID=A0A9Q9IN44_9ACTN|nr:hypothetical protein [Dactylosporangium aurantiacum]MDG6107709.1 hypothetical protein [Dactylosporangium aurantiacum]UWZ58701.1 hypothetical protein Daura_22555 [Dactylosporangium aurantiacum]